MSACGWSRRHCLFTRDFRHGKQPAGSPLHDVRQHAGISTRDATNSNSVFHGRLFRFANSDCKILFAVAFGWWSQSGLNRRPHACKARALPAELWPQANCGARNSDAERLIMVGLGRLELPTSRLSSARSNQLSYKPEKWS